MAIEFCPEVDLEAMDTEQLKAYRAQILEQIEVLEAEGPEALTADDFEVWADKHEELEDILDDIQDLLDEK